MKHLYNVFHFKGLCKHHSVVSVPGLVLNGELRGPEGWLGAKSQWWGLDTRAQKGLSGRPLWLLGEAGKGDHVQNCVCSFQGGGNIPWKLSLCMEHILGRTWGRDRDKHICQRDISVMTISDFSSFMLQLYLMATPFWKMKIQTENPFKRETEKQAGKLKFSRGMWLFCDMPKPESVQ